MQPPDQPWQAKNCNIFRVLWPCSALEAQYSPESGRCVKINAQRPTSNAERPISKTVAFEVGCSTLGVRRFLFRFQGRVAESGLRHSTRNRAWGNPPWVRIPPLPQFTRFF